MKKQAICVLTVLFVILITTTQSFCYTPYWVGRVTSMGVNLTPKTIYLGMAQKKVKPTMQSAGFKFIPEESYDNGFLLVFKKQDTKIQVAFWGCKEYNNIQIERIKIYHKMSAENGEKEVRAILNHHQTFKDHYVDDSVYASPYNNSDYCYYDLNNNELVISIRITYPKIDEKRSHAQ